MKESRLSLPLADTSGRQYRNPPHKPTELTIRALPLGQVFPIKETALLDTIVT